MTTDASSSFLIPGTDDALVFERDAEGRLVRLSCKGRTYLYERDGARVFEDVGATVSEAALPCGLIRHVSAVGESWSEEYLWKEGGLLSRVDGVEVRRDEELRITACVGPEGEWLYSYAGGDLAAVYGPGGMRHLTRGESGRPVRVRDAEGSYEIGYDADGRRTGVGPAPGNWRRDELGRLWTVINPDGTVRTTYLWDGFACIGRIDGAPGEPLAAVFSIDPTFTPTRVITRGGVRRLPRDAFGESLLTHEGVPGLFGGFAHRGFFRYRSRALDPLTGAFDAPDPWHGLEDDPRRAEGYRGPLVVEKSPAGPYAACRNDAVGNTDPTGEFDWPLLISDLTWSLQNNLAGWLGIAFNLNLWGSLFTGKFKRAFSWEGVSGSSNRVGTWGVRMDGVFAASDHAWTYQHIVFATKEHIDALADPRVFAPSGEFRPTLYGTLLRLTPSSGKPFVLHGSNTPDVGGSNLRRNQLRWTRAGGRAEAVVPGSQVPHFPSGGIHFDIETLFPQNGGPSLRGMKCPQDCSIAELAPSGSISTGTIQNRVMIDVPGTGHGLDENSLVLLTSAPSVIAIAELTAAVEQGGLTTVYLDGDVAGLGPKDVRLRGLNPVVITPPDAAVNRLPAPEDKTHLNTTGTTGAYRAGDALRLSQGGAVVGASIIDRLESRLSVDSPLPATMTAFPLEVKAMAVGPSGAATLTAQPDVIEFPGTMPAVGDRLRVSVGAGPPELFVRVTASPVDAANPKQARVDVSVASLGGAGTNVNWDKLTAGGPVLGRVSALDAAAQITYKAEAVRTAPANGFVQIVDQPGATVVVRRVTALVYDALVVTAPLPGAAAGAYGVERFQTKAPDAKDLIVRREQNLTLGPAVPADAVALQIHQYGAPALAAGTPLMAPNFTFNVTGPGVAVYVPPPAPPAALPARPTASQVVALSNAGTVTPALVKRLRLPVTLDRALDTAETANLQVVPLAETGPAYDATRVVPTPVPAPLPDIVTVLPRVTVAGAPIVTQMPRFEPGELVRVAWGGAAAGKRLYRVSAVESVGAVGGTTLTLVGGPALPAPPPPAGPDPMPGLTVTRLVPGNPMTGGSRAGIEGNLDAAKTGLTLSVWTPNALLVDNEVGVVAGNTTQPAIVSAVGNVTLEFSSTTVIPNATNVDLTVPTPAVTRYIPDFKRKGAEVTIPNDDLTAVAADTLAVGPNLIVAVPYVPTARTANGKLSNGTVLVPDDPENKDNELDRRQSLIDHELTHTQQSARWGPMLLSFIPLSPLELTLELTTDMEKPEFSPYVNAKLSEEKGLRRIEIESSPPVKFEKGDDIEISQNGKVKKVELGDKDGGKFFINKSDTLELTVATDGGSDPKLGECAVRREEQGKSEVAPAFMNVLQSLTLGGVLNLASIATYGGLIWIIRKIATAIGQVHKDFPATVGADKLTLTLDNDAGKNAFKTASTIVIDSGKKSLIRRITETADGTVRLESAVDLEGAVKVYPYSLKNTGGMWEFEDYYPASVPDPNRPATIKVDVIDGKTLKLQPHDRVTVKTDAGARDSVVMTVNADGSVELEDPVYVGEKPVVLVGKTGEEDPIGYFDAALLNYLNIGFLQYFHDPYGQLNLRLHPKPGKVGTFLDIFTRTIRYAFGSQSWVAFLGYFFIDNAFKRDEAYLSHMEEEASWNSGDTYCPVGVLRGQFTFESKKGKGRRGIPDGALKKADSARGVVATVGDVVRYWHLPSGGLRDESTTVTRNLGDAPGVHLTDTARVMPFTVAGAGAEPNPNTVVDPARANPGIALVDIFTTKGGGNAADPNRLIGTSFPPSDRGWMPTSATLERTSGLYAAFTRPTAAGGTHRLTVRQRGTGFTTVNGPPDDKGVPIPVGVEYLGDTKEGRLAAEDEDGISALNYDLTVEDVTVTVAGQAVSEGGTVDLLLTQKATAVVTPGDGRTYALSLLRPATGQVLRSDGDLVLAAQGEAGSERVEVCRIYRANAEGFYDSGGLQGRRVHLSPPILHVPVRGFNVRVGREIPFRNAASLDPAAVVAGNMLPGQTGFLLVPVEVDPTKLPTATVSYPAALAYPVKDPVVKITLVPTPDALRAFIGLGGVFKVEFDATEPPEEPADIKFDIPLKTAGSLTSSVKLLPHFQLQRDGGGANFQVAPGNTIALVCTGGVNAGVPSQIPPTPGVTFDPPPSGAKVSVKVDAAVPAGLGQKVIRVPAATDPTHIAQRTIVLT